MKPATSEVLKRGEIAQGRARQRKGRPRRKELRPLKRKNPLTIEMLGWTTEKAREVRSRLASFAADWDDPVMDVYDES